jgi:hypothetical protein
MITPLKMMERWRTYSEGLDFLFARQERLQETKDEHEHDPGPKRTINQLLRGD